MEVDIKNQFQNEQSFLVGKPTNFKNISCRGAKFINVKNTTKAHLPSDQELLDAPEQKGLLGKLRKLLRL